MFNSFVVTYNSRKRKKEYRYTRKKEWRDDGMEKEVQVWVFPPDNTTEPAGSHSSSFL